MPTIKTLSTTRRYDYPFIYFGGEEFNKSIVLGMIYHLNEPEFVPEISEGSGSIESTLFKGERPSWQ